MRNLIPTETLIICDENGEFIRPFPLTATRAAQLGRRGTAQWAENGRLLRVERVYRDSAGNEFSIPL